MIYLLSIFLTNIKMDFPLSLLSSLTFFSFKISYLSVIKVIIISRMNTNNSI